MSHVAFDFVLDAVQRQASLDPSKAALIDCDGREVAYGELCRRSSRLARQLRGLGVKPETCVAVGLDRSVELVVAILAIFEAGGVYAPVDTSYPKARIALMLEHLRPAVLITRLEVPDDLSCRSSLTVMAPPSDDGASMAMAPSPADSGRASVHPDNLAYIIYTSGSTGAPKGVAMPHRGLTRLIRWQIDDGPSSLSTLQFTPIGFDVIFQEIFSTLCTGGTLVLVPDEMRRDPDRLLVRLCEASVERLFLPYVALQQLAQAAKTARQRPQSLKHVITAGERLIVTEAISEFFSSLPECRLDNQYGPTEAHLVTRWTLESDRATWPTLPPIGPAVAGARVYSCDDALEIVPSGEPAELFAGGDGLARGYFRAPGRTAERFLPDPFAAAAGSRMYKTGGVGCIDARGVVEFLGRSDDQIKVRGFRVEPGEVELALTDHPHVRQAAVGLRTIASNSEALVGYVVGQGAPVTALELTRYLHDRLPDYMVPSRFVNLDALPLTPSGKVDRKLLSGIALPDYGQPPARNDTVVNVVRAIWQRVLGHDEFEPDDDFFDIGGDSLLATWVVAELSLALGRPIELSILLEDSTMNGLARTLEGMALRPVASANRSSEIVTLRAGPSQRILFLVHPLGGELLAYRALAQAIRLPLRILGLRWQPEEASEAKTSMAEMAAAHLAQVRAVQPEGPYLFAGWSFGGVLAFELAQQLVAAGERVDFLGLLDANPILDPTTGRPTRETPLYERMTRMLVEIDQKLDGGDDVDGASPLHRDPYLAGLLGSNIPKGVSAMHLRKNLHITRDSIWAAMNYRAVPYSGPIDLFQPDGASAAIKHSLEAELRKLAQGTFRYHPIPGDHASILQAPAVSVMAQALDSVLQAATA